MGTEMIDESDMCPSMDEEMIDEFDVFPKFLGSEGKELHLL